MYHSQFSRPFVTIITDGGSCCPHRSSWEGMNSEILLFLPRNQISTTNSLYTQHHNLLHDWSNVFRMNLQLTGWVEDNELYSPAGTWIPRGLDRLYSYDPEGFRKEDMLCQLWSTRLWNELNTASVTHQYQLETFR